MPTRVRSYSKINLGLAVGPARQDGFHGLTTIYQTLALHDFVTVSARPAAATRITLTANHPGVPTTERGTAERNTAWKMVAGALLRLGITAEVEIALEKRLPVQGGMGAGSANAVAALLGLERELGMALPKVERLQLAAQIGSDVPLFLLGGTVLGVGRGEQVVPLPDSAPIHCVVAIPSIGVSTAQAFAELDKRSATQSTPVHLTFQQGDDTLMRLSYALSSVWSPDGIWISDKSAGPSGIVRPVGTQTEPSNDLAEHPLLALVRTGIENDFEEVVFSQHPSLRSTKRDLLGTSGDPGIGDDAGAVYAALSGSGSALFGLYRTATAARAAQQRVQANGTRAILTETLPRREYWSAMYA